MSLLLIYGTTRIASNCSDNRSVLRSTRSQSPMQANERIPQHFRLHMIAHKFPPANKEYKRHTNLEDEYVPKANERRGLAIERIKNVCILKITE